MKLSTSLLNEYSSVCLPTPESAFYLRHTIETHLLLKHWNPSVIEIITCTIAGKNNWLVQRVFYVAIALERLVAFVNSYAHIAD